VLVGQVWQKRYQWVLITSHDQLAGAIRCVRANRPRNVLSPIEAEGATPGVPRRANA
jgi:hypothetical protein